MKAVSFFDDEDASRFKNENPAHLTPQSYVAFDFEKDGRVVGKLNLFSFWEIRQTRQSPQEITFNLIIGMPVIGPTCKEALHVWEQCLKTFPAEFGGEPRVECIGFDLLKPTQISRIQPYLRLWTSSFNAVTHFYTLGGALQDSTTLKGIELLKLFWHIVCRVEDGADFSKKKKAPILHEGWAEIIVNWEFKPGEALPKPKFYMPIWKWIPTELDICERLSGYWKRIGWEQQAESYTQDWQETL
ncbi:aromatic prenyltransferase [Pyrenochaeta sp. MPI-SDFR-AT-0127]|nr:aromatic prenyltransferase [Pyrenochaeta sp. MPI-SDFR-AT-0127]